LVGAPSNIDKSILFLLEGETLMFVVSWERDKAMSMSDRAWMLSAVCLTADGSKIDLKATADRVKALLKSFGTNLSTFNVSECALSMALDEVLTVEYERLKAVRYISAEAIARMVQERCPEFSKDDVFSFIENNISKSLKSQSMFFGNIKNGCVCFRKYMERLSSTERAKASA
jgi:hypothetical protein